MKSGQSRSPALTANREVYVPRLLHQHLLAVHDVEALPRISDAAPCEVVPHRDSFANGVGDGGVNRGVESSEAQGLDLGAAKGDIPVAELGNVNRALLAIIVAEEPGHVVENPLVGISREGGYDLQAVEEDRHAIFVDDEDDAMPLAFDQTAAIAKAAGVDANHLAAGVERAILVVVHMALEDGVEAVQALGTDVHEEGEGVEVATAVMGKLEVAVNGHGKGAVGGGEAGDGEEAGCRQVVDKLRTVISLDGSTQGSGASACQGVGGIVERPDADGVGEGLVHPILFDAAQLKGVGIVEGNVPEADFSIVGSLLALSITCKERCCIEASFGR